MTFTHEAVADIQGSRLLMCVKIFTKQAYEEVFSLNLKLILFMSLGTMWHWAVSDTSKEQVASTFMV